MEDRSHPTAHQDWHKRWRTAWHRRWRGHVWWHSTCLRLWRADVPCLHIPPWHFLVSWLCLYISLHLSATSKGVHLLSHMEPLPLALSRKSVWSPEAHGQSNDWGQAVLAQRWQEHLSCPRQWQEWLCPSAPSSHSSYRTGNDFFMLLCFIAANSADSCVPHQFLHLVHSLPACHLGSSTWEGMAPWDRLPQRSWAIHAPLWPQSQFALTAGSAQAEPSLSAA